MVNPLKSLEDYLTSGDYLSGFSSNYSVTVAMHDNAPWGVQIQTSKRATTGTFHDSKIAKLDHLGELTKARTALRMLSEQKKNILYVLHYNQPAKFEPHVRKHFIYHHGGVRLDLSALAFQLSSKTTIEDFSKRGESQNYRELRAESKILAIDAINAYLTKWEEI